jgi:hypothetical protein
MVRCTARESKQLRAGDDHIPHITWPSEKTVRVGCREPVAGLVNGPTEGGRAVADPVRGRLGFNSACAASRTGTYHGRVHFGT